MAKNLKSRWKNFIESMNTEDKNAEMKTDNTIHPESELAEGHNPDVGTPETRKEEEAPNNESERWQKEAMDWKDKYLRLYAEFDNFRKRSMKERGELLATASADVIKEMLPILDDFDRAVKANESVEDISVIREGFVLIHQKLYRQLEGKGLKPIDASGKPFDTDFHEAITQIPAPTPEMAGKVVDELERGYTLNEKVIRFSKVVIGQS